MTEESTNKPDGEDFVERLRATLPWHIDRDIIAKSRMMTFRSGTTTTEVWRRRIAADGIEGERVAR